MASSYKKLSEPVTLQGHVLRNRVVFGAHTANMAEAGLPGARMIGYYVERAMGGAAMVVVEPMPVHPAAVLTRGNFRVGDDSVIPAFRQLTASIKAHGAVAIQQLYHVGSHGDSDNSFHAHWSPSGLPSYHDSDGSHPMSAGQIQETIDGFVSAARRCQQAGFDGVEVWGAYQGLIDQFWAPWSNRRSDEWGGSLENRTRFSREILTRIRAECGEGFIVGLSISDEPDYGVALQREELASIVAMHDELGLIDYVTCGTGGYFDFHKLMPTFVYPEKMSIDLCTVIKRHVRHALVISESHIRTPENAETVLGEGSADLVSIVRGQIADPHLVNKALQGRTEDIRGCLSCNQMCWGRRSRDYWISCLINPSAGREFEWHGDRFQTAAFRKKVLVIGAGPAGLEAARACAERGHQVILAEASNQLGGNFRLAGMQPRRAQILDLIDWYERQLNQLGVEVRLNTYVELDEIRAEAADHIILATGSMSPHTGFQKSLPHLEYLPGIEKGSVYSVEEIMARQAVPGHRVLVLDEGGGWKGCGTAWKLAQEGHEVTLVTPDAMVAKELQRTTADLPLRKVLAGLGVRFYTDTSIDNWTGSAAELKSHLDGSVTTLSMDSLVMATTNVVVNELALALTQASVRFTEIGDCAAPRQAPYAFYDGRKAALEI